MCRSGGFCSEDIFSRSVGVQSGSGMCVSKWSHVSITGLSVMISAYNKRGGGWCWFWEMYLVRCG